MRPTQIKEALRKTIEARRPAFIWGAPGVGKSDVVAQVADELFGGEGKSRDDYFVDLRLLLMDPVDLRGLPKLEDDVARWVRPEFFPTKGSGIIFLDELNAATPLVQAGGYQLTLNFRIGEHRLPDGWCIVAAGNRETDRAVTHRMPSPLANRFIHLNFEVEPDDWVAWALKNNVRTEVISFMRVHGHRLLHSFDPKRNDKAFPTPRSWCFVSDILNTSPEGIVELALIQGTVGEGAGAEFKAHLDLVGKMPNIDMILMNPEKVSVPKEPAILYALSTALARKMTEVTIENICIYLNKIPKEFQVLTVKDAVSLNESLYQTKSYIDWASKNAELMI